MGSRSLVQPFHFAVVATLGVTLVLSWSVSMPAAAVGWSTAELIETLDIHAYDPRVAVDPAGNAVAVWRQSDGTRFNVWANRYVAGVGWGSAELIETDNTGEVDYPLIAVDLAGNAIAVWSQSDSVRSNVWSNRYVVGVGWGTAALVEANDTEDAAFPDIAVDPSGDAIAVWQQWDGVRYNIWANRYLADVGWGSAEMIETDDTGDAGYPHIALDPGGNGIAVWYQGDGVRYNIWANRYVVDVGWSVPTLIETNDTTSASTDPFSLKQVAVDRSGNALAVWRQGTGFDIWANRYVAGVGWGSAELIETDSGPAYFPEIAMDAVGNAVAVWRQGIDIWANRYVAGVGWGSAEAIETEPGFATDPRVAVDPAGNAVAVWHQSDGVRSNIWANRYVAGVGWGSAELIEMDDAGSAGSPSVAIDPAGNALGVWSQSDAFRYSIWANRYEAPPDTWPPSPPALTAAALTGTAASDLSLIWSAAPDEGWQGGTTSYRVLRAVGDIAGPYAEVATLPADGSSTYAYTCVGCGHSLVDTSRAFFMVQAVDAANNTADSNLAAKYAKGVATGRNLLSMPVQVTDPSASTVLQTLGTNLTAAWTYSASDTLDAWHSYSVVKGGGDLTTLPFGSAFWVDMAASGVYTVAGLVINSPLLGLQPGWNLVGYAAVASETRAVSLAGMAGVTRVQTFDSLAPYFLRAVPANELLVWGEVYWIYTTVGGLWVQG